MARECRLLPGPRLSTGARAVRRLHARSEPLTSARPFHAPSGAWVPSEPEALRPDPSDEALRKALAALDQPVIVVDDGGRPAVVTGGRAALGVQAEGDALP